VTEPPRTADPRPRRRVATRARLYLVIAALIALAAAFTVFAIGWSQYAVTQRTDDLSRQVAALAKGQAVGNQLPGASVTARDRLFQVEAGLIGAALFVTDDSGVVERSTVASAPASLPLTRVTQEAPDGTTSGVLRNDSGAQVLVVAAPIDATRRLVAVQSLAEIRQAQTGLLVVAGIALLVAAAVAFVAGGLLARRLTAPIVRLESAAEQVAAGAFGTQVAEEGDAETASLARSFNRMSARVADAYAAQKAFAGDVSHEIRTPLTSIRGFAEAMLDGTIADEERRQHALEVIRDEAGRISEVSGALLALSELDAGAVEIVVVPVSTALLADALSGRFSATAEGGGIELQIALPDAPSPIADPNRLLQALSALVANAITHTPRGGRVRVSAAAGGGEWRVAVDDSGPGIPAEKRELVFDRFARLDRSRSAASGGAGLGLAICRRLVELMGGSIEVGKSGLGGARFAITLPVAEGGGVEAPGANAPDAGVPTPPRV
jgi:signal transduction histidine kinase